ncbi:MAG: hypothetical protein AAFN93_07035 [Bacteroidota bacterium]
MDNIQIILYIVFIAIALLSRLLKAKKPEPKRPVQDPSDTSEPISFEDLLKEFTGEKPRTETVLEEADQSLEYVDYETEERHYDDDRALETYRTATAGADKFKTLDQQVELNVDRPLFGHFDEYDDEEETNTNDLVTMLKDEDGIRKAVILSEILKRKY